MLSNTGLAPDVFDFGGELRLAIFSLHSDLFGTARDASAGNRGVSIDTPPARKRIPPELTLCLVDVWFVVLRLGYASLPRGVLERILSAFVVSVRRRCWNSLTQLVTVSTISRAVSRAAFDFALTTGRIFSPFFTMRMFFLSDMLVLLRVALDLIVSNEFLVIQFPYLSKLRTLDVVRLAKKRPHRLTRSSHAKRVTSLSIFYERGNPQAFPVVNRTRKQGQHGV